MLLNRKCASRDLESLTKAPQKEGEVELMLKVSARCGSKLVVVVGMAVSFLLTAAIASASSSAAGLTRPEELSGIAVSGDGKIYFADTLHNIVFVRDLGGSIRVAAGTGQAGFAGDGGLATEAKFDRPTSLAMAPDGVLYVVDSRNNRVRAILPNGDIKTIAGNGKEASGFLPNLGELASNVQISVSSGVTVNAANDVYLVDGNLVLELSPSWRIIEVIDLAHPKGITLRYVDCEPYSLAVNISGTLAIGCGNSRELIDRTSSGDYGIIDNAYRPHDYPGLLYLGGTLLEVNHESLLRRQGGHVTTLFGMGNVGAANLVVPGGIAVNSKGDVFFDSEANDGFTNEAALVERSKSGAIKLLDHWKN